MRIVYNTTNPPAPRGRDDRAILTRACQRNCRSVCWMMKASLMPPKVSRRNAVWETVLQHET